ncbi:MAG: porin [Pseudorhodoplanes sp.]|nr:porin [Pseudorhodoplanes sp.]
MSRNVRAPNAPSGNLDAKRRRAAANVPSCRHGRSIAETAGGRRAKPEEYVKVCSLYGAGFYYIPGTDTCIKIGGFVRTGMESQRKRLVRADAGRHQRPLYP